MPIAWTVEVAAYTMLFIIILGAPKLMQLEGHVSIDLITARVSAHARNLMNFIASILGILICSTIVYYGIKVSAELIQKNTLVVEAIAIPQYFIIIIIPIGFIFLLLQYIRRTFGLYRMWRQPETEVPAVAKL
jgi:TRAP-type C4-dicarboxylate transport system permease small subunit